MKTRVLSAAEACERLTALGAEFVATANPSYVHPPASIVPLAPKITTPATCLVAAVMDMDGTTTTTEKLCLHSLEQMVRRITGRESAEAWSGLDPARDYPHVIGNSTTRHVEYLIDTYREAIDPAAFGSAFEESVRWTIDAGLDAGRVEEASTALKTLSTPRGTALDSFEDRVRAAIEIYYCRYHQILSALARGEADVPGLADAAAGGRVIEPMPAVAFFLALIKGWLG